MSDPFVPRPFKYVILDDTYYLVDSNGLLITEVESKSPWVFQERVDGFLENLEDENEILVDDL